MNATAHAVPATVDKQSRAPARRRAASPTGEAAALMATIARAASDPSIDVEKLERLMAMHERIKAGQAEQAFADAMSKAQAEMPQVFRDAENSHTKSRYARLETIAKEVNPIITKHGFALSFGTADCPEKDRYRITCRVSHVAGHSREYQVDVPADVMGAKGNANKTATQGFGSTMSYGRRYLLLLIFNIATTDTEDDDGNGGVEFITHDQIAKITSLIAQVGADKDRFLEFLEVPSLFDLPADRFNEAVRALEAKRRSQK